MIAVLLALLLPVAAAGAEQICRATVAVTEPPLNRCHGGTRVSIAAVGDVLLHSPLQRRAYADPENGFYGIFSRVAPIFKAADIAYANLEGPTAPGVTRGGRNAPDPGAVFDDRVYSSYPQFNYHPRLIKDLQRGGIDIVSTANNHTMDRGVLGADRTIDELRKAKMPFFGSVKSGEVKDFTTYTKTKLGRIAWIACSYSTNGLPDPKGQVLMCFENRDQLLRLVGQAAARHDVAGVIVTPHWGFEYQHNPNGRQKQLARDLIAAGAMVVIGTHPHVVQPWETVTVGDRKGLVIYSTGNFISGQVQLARRTGGLAWVELCRAMPSKNLNRVTKPKITVAGSGWVPLYMVRTQAGPELLIPKDSSEPARLVARHWPKNGINMQMRCTASKATLMALQ